MVQAILLKDFQKVKGESKIVPVHAMKACRGSTCIIAPLILKFCTRWWSVVSLTLQPFYPWYPMQRCMGGPHIQPGCFGEEKNPPCRELNPSSSSKACTQYYVNPISFHKIRCNYFKLFIFYSLKLDNQFPQQKDCFEFT